MTLLLLYCSVLALKAIAAGWYVWGYPTPRHNASQDRVNVCQPILSGDPELEEALQDNLTALPRVQFVWLVDESDEVAGEITARLLVQNPGRTIKIVACPDPPEGINPKLFKLERARSIVPLGVFLVLDDDTRLPPATLDAFCQALDYGDLATGLPFYRDACNIYGNLLAQFVNNNSALSYLPLLPFLPAISINGMGYAAEVKTLERMGGFTPVFHHLTDDLAVALQVVGSGGRIIQTPYPLEVATTLGSFTRYIDQMHRWYVFAILLLRRQGLTINMLIGVLAILPPMLLLAGAVMTLQFPSIMGFACLTGTLFFRAGVLCLFQRRLSGKVRHHPGLSLLSELLQPLHLAHALFFKTIRWRIRRYRVYDNDHFVSS